MWLMLRQDNPGDYVVATGEQHSVRELLAQAFAEVGIGLAFRGVGVEETGYVDSLDVELLNRARGDSSPTDGRVDEQALPPAGKTVVRMDPRYFRPTDVTTLLGDASKARRELGWEPQVTFPQLVHEMVWSDLAEARRDRLCQQEAYRLLGGRE